MVGLAKHSVNDPNFKDILILARCPEDIQAEAIDELKCSKANTLPEAIRNVKRRRIVERGVTVPDGKYRCLIIDPPWPQRDGKNTASEKLATGTSAIGSRRTANSMTERRDDTPV